MTELPLWALYVVTFGTPLSALAGVLVAQWLTRRTAREADVRSRREELMRNLRWAAELAVEQDTWRSRIGVGQLVALSESDLLDPGGQTFVDAALMTVVTRAEDKIDASDASGATTQVIEVDPVGPRPSSDTEQRRMGATEKVVTVMTETRIVYVTAAERMAAQAMVERAKRFNRSVSPAIVKIADARVVRREDLPDLVASLE